MRIWGNSHIPASKEKTAIPTCDTAVFHVNLRRSYLPRTPTEGPSISRPGGLSQPRRVDYRMRQGSPSSQWEAVAEGHLSSALSWRPEIPSSGSRPRGSLEAVPVIAPPLCSLGIWPTQRCTYNGVYLLFKVRTYALVGAVRSTRQRKGIQNALHDRLILQC